MKLHMNIVTREIIVNVRTNFTLFGQFDCMISFHWLSLPLSMNMACMLMYLLSTHVFLNKHNQMRKKWLGRRWPKLDFKVLRLCPPCLPQWRPKRTTINFRIPLAEAPFELAVGMCNVLIIFYVICLLQSIERAKMQFLKSLLYRSGNRGWTWALAGVWTSYERSTMIGSYLIKAITALACFVDHF